MYNFVEVFGHNLKSSQTFGSVFIVYITNQFQTTLLKGKTFVHYVQEFGLRAGMRVGGGGAVVKQEEVLNFKPESLNMFLFDPIVMKGFSTLPPPLSLPLCHFLPSQSHYNFYTFMHFFRPSSFSPSLSPV
jgi:hypothetical protein